MRILSIAIGFLTLFATARAEDATSRLALVNTIPLPHVGGRIDHMSLDTGGQRLFVAALGNNTVEVIDLKSGKVTQSLSGFAEPQGMVYVPEFDRLFVANGSDGTCRILDGHTFQLISKVELGDDADNVRYDPSTKQVYVGYGDGGLAVIEAKNGVKTADIKLSAHPESFQMETGGPRIFVNVPGADQIVVVDREKRTVTAKWTPDGARANFPMALDEADHRLFIGCRHPAQMLVLDTESGKTVAHVAIEGDTDDLFYDAKRRQIYVSCGGGFIDVIRQKTADAYEMAESIPTTGGARTSFFVPERSELYLAVRAGMISGGAEIRVYQAK